MRVDPTPGMPPLLWSWLAPKGDRHARVAFSPRQAWARGRKESWCWSLLWSQARLPHCSRGQRAEGKAAARRQRREAGWPKR